MTRATAAILATLLLWPASALAQPAHAVVVTVSVGDAMPVPHAERLDDLAASARERGVELMSAEDARRDFERAGSTAPAPLSGAEIDGWTALSHQIVRHLAQAEYDEANAALRQAAELPERAIESLARDEARARLVLDTCLYGVRALVETGAPGAEERALSCRQLVPRVAPSRYRHPPEVADVLARVDARIAASTPSSLVIESERADCTVRLNGVAIGTTPVRVAGIAPGDYRAQVECDGAIGRVHRVRVGDEPSTLRVDTAFERAIQSDPALVLSYPSAELAEARRVDDAIHAGAVLGAAEVWLVHDEHGATHVDRISLVREEVPAAAGAPEPQPTPTPVRDRSLELVFGSALGGLAIAGFASAWAIYGTRRDMGPELEASRPEDPNFIPLRDSWLNLRYAVWSVAGASAAVGIASLPLLMSEEEGVPWWSWVIAAAGAGAMTVGIVEIATATPCPDDIDHGEACADRAGPVDRGAIEIAMGAPLLAVPLVYLARALVGPRASASAHVGADRAILQVGGTL